MRRQATNLRGNGSNYLVQDVVFSHAAYNFHSDPLAGLRGWNWFVFDLHGIYGLFDVCGAALDYDLVPLFKRSHYFDNCYIRLRVIVLNSSCFDIWGFHIVVDDSTSAKLELSCGWFSRL